MKKKKKKNSIKKFIKWFLFGTNKVEANSKEYKNLYQLIENLQFKVESLENEHMVLLREMNKIKKNICDTESAESEIKKT